MTRPAVTLHLGDCLDVLRQMREASVDAVVTDPPYGLLFMGQRWDYDVPSVDVWAECLRVLKPGGHLLAFAGTRTQHRMAVRIEDAGFEIRDLIAWVYGSGFPKSLDVSKAVDRELDNPRAVAGYGEIVDRIALDYGGATGKAKNGLKAQWNQTQPNTDAARQWSGWGTALKPALEPITVAQKPLAGTVAETVLAYGTGAINVDGCRVGDGADKGDWPISQRRHADVAYTMAPVPTDKSSGRWPSNLIHDGGPDVADLLCDAARFFYTPKASRADRDEGLEAFAARTAAETVERAEGSAGLSSPRAGAGRTSGARNHHPTVKPTDLMRYLVRLVTPPGGLVLDPFAGSGSTGKAAVLEGFRFVGIERDPEYVAIAEARCRWAVAAREAIEEPPLLRLIHDA